MISSENGLLVVTVLLNVRGRDVGSFVEEAREAVAAKVPLPAARTWSGAASTRTSAVPASACRS
jgi:Cu/Ag efflux pump CusA